MVPVLCISRTGHYPALPLSVQFLGTLFTSIIRLNDNLTISLIKYIKTRSFNSYSTNPRPWMAPLLPLSIQFHKWMSIDSILTTRTQCNQSEVRCNAVDWSQMVCNELFQGFKTVVGNLAMVLDLLRSKNVLRLIYLRLKVFNRILVSVIEGGFLHQVQCL